MALRKKQMVEFLEKMLVLRRFEENVVKSFRQGLVPGYCHVYLGEEAIAVGACAALQEGDYITSTHRGHGHCIAKGADLKGVMAELYGKRTGCCGGKGGSMHVADFKRNIIGANGIVGGGFPIAVGCGLSSKMRGTDQVCVCFFGDGASNQGTFHESLNMASVWKLPVIFLCENNFYGMATPQKNHQMIDKISERASSYGMPGVTVDGNDVEAVYKAMLKAVGRARDGDGPTLVECTTYRWTGHTMVQDDLDSGCRPKKELEAWKKQCPIKRFGEKLVKAGAITKQEIKKIDDEVNERVEEAVIFAKESPMPDPKDALKDVFV